MKSKLLSALMLLLLGALVMGMSAPSCAQSTNKLATIPACDTERCKYYFSEYKRRTREGYADAMETLASFYHVGYGTERNLTLALKWYKRAAKYHSVVGAYKAGLFMLTEQDFLDTEQAIKYLKKAGRRQYSNANYILALIYSQGQYIDTDFSQADHWLSYALSANHQRSMEYCQTLTVENVLTEQNFPDSFALCPSNEISRAQPTSSYASTQSTAPTEPQTISITLISNNQQTQSSPYQAPSNHGDMEVIEVNPGSLPELFDQDLASMKFYVAEKRRQQTGHHILRRPCSLTLSCYEMSKEELIRLRGMQGAGMLGNRGTQVPRLPAGVGK
ncbi:tetratricopeptide repeat protein [Thalassotalea sp. HSM 43]|uniref:tetratricopeptide repeat protein n=1 Tax=Thalassotalea sp. HSM 43 TaxID=2552945 RepID=UPI001674685E|nr:tetratricopeptide repeat protein [Thalassotalea sp. HSM 43]